MAEISFEKALDNLEKIVAKMEAGTLSLDDSLAQYEQGVKLIRQCNSKLDSCEKKIELINKNADGSFDKTDFEDKESSKTAKKTKKTVKKDVEKDAESNNDKEEGMLF